MEAVVAVVAALREEIDALAGRLAGRTRAAAPVLADGRLAGREVVLGVTGDGSRAAAKGLEALLDARRVEAVLAVGLAGALTPDLEPAEVVAAREVREGAELRLEPPAWRWTARAFESPRLRPATAVSVDRILVTAAEKSGWRARMTLTSAAVADLESTAWAGLATARGLPWLVLRAVSDTAGESLPLDFNRCLDGDGSIDRRRVLLRALARPGRLPALLRLRRRARTCAERLAAAVEEVLGW